MSRMPKTVAVLVAGVLALSGTVNAKPKVVSAVIVKIETGASLEVPPCEKGVLSIHRMNSYAVEKICPSPPGKKPVVQMYMCIDSSVKLQVEVYPNIDDSGVVTGTTTEVWCSNL